MPLEPTQQALVALDEAIGDYVTAHIELERRRIIALFEQADSACSPWAIALITGEGK